MGDQIDTFGNNRLWDRLMADVILHIGFGKTGSSSIQKYLSIYGTEKIAGTNLVYCAWTANDEFLQGETLYNTAAASCHGYIASTMVVPGSYKGLVKGIEEVHGKGLVPLLSQEDWSRTGREFTTVFEELGLKYKVIAYVRPQVEWLYAGWWQWWAWDENFASPDEVIEKWGMVILNWNAWLKFWQNSPSCEAVKVRLHCRDVVDDFLDQIDADPPVE